MAFTLNTGTVSFTFVKREVPDPIRRLLTPPGSRPGSPVNNDGDYVLYLMTPPPSRPVSPGGNGDDQPPHPTTGHPLITAIAGSGPAAAAAAASPGRGEEDESEEDEDEGEDYDDEDEGEDYDDESEEDDKGSEEDDKESGGDGKEGDQEEAPPQAPLTTNDSSSTASDASQARTTANRANGRPRGGRVYTPVRNISCIGQAARCQRCLKLVSKKCWADHRKAHVMEHSGTAIVPYHRRCNNCVAKGRLCSVNINPGEKDRNTFRCYCCLKYKESCSILSTYRTVPLREAMIHPVLE